MAPSIVNSGLRSYAQDELLCIRDALPLDRRVLEVLSVRADIACIVRLPEDKLRFSQTISCPAQSLSDITNRRRNIQQSSMDHAASIEDNGEHAITEIVTSRDLRSTQWNLRRRDSSDRSSQPYSAPTGSIAQQSENFQRFYRAVVSPTHVRVTAGGRIVPNTRTAAPPAFEWNNDKHCFESRKHPPEADLILPQSSTWNHGMPFPPGLSPMMPGGFIPPYPFLPPGNLAALPPPQVASFDCHNTVTTSAGAHQRLASDASGPETSATLSQPIKISPPTQFDQTKPFMYNGQLVYPVPPPQHPLPMPMTLLGNSNFVPQAPAGHMSSFALHPHFPIPLPNFSNPMMFPAGQPLPMPMPHPVAGHDNTSMVHPLASPMMPMPALSDLTRSQIQGLRHHLNIIESQAANNSKATDQQYLQSQRAAVLAQISNMESMLQAQLAQENPSKVRSQRNNNVSEDPKVISRRQNSISQYTQSSVPQSRAEQPHNIKGEVHTKDEVDRRKTSARSDSMNRSRLSAAAAMAPPFQPRAHPSAIVPPQRANLGDDRSVFSNSPIESDETQAQIETRLLSRASTNWGQDASNKPIVPMSAPPSMPKAQSMKEHRAQIEPEKQSMQRSSTFNGHSDAAPQHSAHSSVHQIASQHVPYLVGLLPQGLSGADANLGDMVYPRPLTDLEVRARHIYWGKAPRAMQTGLPKFDGKDFYPPSPVKDQSRMPAYGTWSGPVYNNPPTGQIINFDQLFMEPGVPGNQPPSPEHFPPQHASYTLLPADGLIAVNGLGIHELTDASRYPTQQSDKTTEHSRPETPTSTTRTAAIEDFSNLFLEPGVPGYQSPDRSKFSQQPMQLEASDKASEMSFSSKRTQKGKSPEGCGEETQAPGAETESDSHSTHSTFECHLTPHSNGDPQFADLETSFAERVANFSNIEQQTLFLQNMLKSGNQVTKTMTGSAVSGTISAATATGYLPHYRGSAIASLAPTISNVSAERDAEGTLSKSHLLRETSTSSTLAGENRPLSRSTGPDSLGFNAEGYMRFLTQKMDDKHIIEQGWNANTTGTGPVVGSDW